VTDNIMAMPVGRLSLSRITYICDLQRASSLTIPLGVMAEMTLGSVRVLGLIARTRLADDEASAIGQLARHKLLTPFDFLKDDFDWAWANTQAGRALAALAGKYTDSLFFSTPKEEQVRKALALSTGAAAGEFARNEMRQRRDEDFFSLLVETREEAQIAPSRDISELAAA
jgi:hypothetical protein